MGNDGLLTMSLLFYLVNEGSVGTAPLLVGHVLRRYPFCSKHAILNGYFRLENIVGRRFEILYFVISVAHQGNHRCLYTPYVNSPFRPHFLRHDGE